MVRHYKSQVQAVPAADMHDAMAHYESKLRFETDPADVQFDMEHGAVDFVLLDVRSPQDYASAHVPGAVNIPTAQITRMRIEADYPAETLFVVYCWGPGCNGSTKAALRLSRLGYAVKEMIGGIEYWQKEGYATQEAQA